ncbi:MAG: substrate-binding domain-containing protein [Thermoplasmatota archaeon]
MSVVLSAFALGRAGMALTGSTPRQMPVEIVAASLYAKLLQKDAADAGIPAVVQAEGSVAGARDITLKPGTYSLYASVDPAVISSLLMPQTTAWYVSIAWDRMVIGYSPTAPGASVLANLSARIQADIATNRSSDALNATALEWDTVFAGGSRIGTTNPNTDPEGYRAILVLELVGLEKFGNASHYLSQFAAAQTAGRVVTVDAGSRLFGYVQSSSVDYDIALYESAAASASISYARMAPVADLGDPTQAATYGLVNTTITTGGTPLVIRGAPVTLAVTIPLDAPDRVDGAALVTRLISPAGHVEMQAMGIRPLLPARLEGNASLAPAALREWLGSSSLVAGP